MVRPGAPDGADGDGRGARAGQPAQHALVRVRQHHACHDNSVGVTTVCGIRIRLHMKSVTAIAVDSLASPCRSGSADARVYKPRYAGRALVARLTERAEEAEEAAPHAWLPAGALPARAVPSVRGGRAEEDGAHDSCFLPGHAL
eukprot:scaffold123749_cov48-Phaeocystis_antarctica.AAC.1